MKFIVIDIHSKNYYQSLGIRYEVLRKPLGLHFDIHDFQHESNEFHLAAIIENRLVASLILSPIDHKTLKMRQVAVDPEFQSKKIGSQLIQFSEEFAVSNEFYIIELHARKTAFDFYQKLNYHCISDEFLEVGIPHYKMKKTILS